MKGYLYAAAIISSLALAVGVGCGSSSGGSGGTSGSSGSGGSGGSSGSGGGGSGCITSMTSVDCVITTSTVPGETCTGLSGKMGTCPSANLVGCCTVTESSGTYSVTSQACSYEGTASDDESACTTNKGTWSTSF